MEMQKLAKILYPIDMRKLARPVILFISITLIISTFLPWGVQASTPTERSANFYDNAVWISDSYWSGNNALGKQCIMTNNQSGVISDMTNAHISNAFWYVGNLNSDGTITYTHSNSFITNAINKFHASGITVWAWIENIGASPLFDISHTNGLLNQMKSCVNKGFDGIHFDDEPDFANTSYTVQQFIDFNNDASVFMHNIGKLYSVAVAAGLYSGMVVSHFLHVDYIVLMFYDNDGSYFENTQCDALWQESFGMGIWSSYGAPVSPTIIGIMNNVENGNFNQRVSLSWKIAKIDYLLETYGIPASLAGFCHWIYEYVSSSDWVSWDSCVSNNAFSPLAVSANFVVYCPIDFHHTGKVNFDDLTYFIDAYIHFNQGETFDPSCDLNHDGKMDFTDLVLFAQYYIDFA